MLPDRGSLCRRQVVERSGRLLVGVQFPHLNMTQYLKLCYVAFKKLPWLFFVPFLRCFGRRKRLL